MKVGCWQGAIILISLQELLTGCREKDKSNCSSFKDKRQPGSRESKGSNWDKHNALYERMSHKKCQKLLNFYKGSPPSTENAESPSSPSLHLVPPWLDRVPSWLKTSKSMWVGEPDYTMANSANKCGWASPNICQIHPPHNCTAVKAQLNLIPKI